MKQVADMYMEVIPGAMRDMRKSLRSFRGNGLSLPQFRVLARLRRDPRSNKALAEHIGLSVAAMSRLVQGLKKRGLLEKSEGIIDRRENHIALSKKGRTVIEQIREITRQELTLKLEQLDQNEQKKLREGLSILSKFFPSPNEEGEAFL